MTKVFVTLLSMLNRIINEELKIVILSDNEDCDSNTPSLLCGVPSGTVNKEINKSQVLLNCQIKSLVNNFQYIV